MSEDPRTVYVEIESAGNVVTGSFPFAESPDIFALQMEYIKHMLRKAQDGTPDRV